ncbi:MAG: ROK family protein [Thermotogae bacterium]|nr:ROK family protein [Thermotogota bacterium]RKX46844.1 MAG: ROK family protein [Thermotogota bacterium]
MKVFAVDLGGTFIKVGVVDEKGSIRWKRSVKTPPPGRPLETVSTLAKLLREAQHEFQISYIGIGCPGSIDRDQGLVRYSPNLDWHDFPLAEALSKETGLEVYVENDANAFVLGEKWFGAGKNCEHIVALTFGTGVGGGVISHNILITGYLGIGAELGHVIVEPNGPQCGCGSYGCLEAIASARSVARLATEMVEKYPDSVLSGLDRIAAEDVFAAYRKGDKLAKILLERVTHGIARAVGAYVQFFNPQLIVFGGGLARSSDVLIPLVEEKVPLYVMPSFLGTFKIVQSQLLEDAGIKGAASIVFQRKLT